MTPYPDNFAYVIPAEDAIVHALDHPFCWDQTCGCHEHPLLIQEVSHFVTDGLLTPDEATYFVAGKTV